MPSSNNSWVVFLAIVPLTLTIIIAMNGGVVEAERLRVPSKRPPKPRWGPNKQILRQRNSVAFNYWNENHEDNLWEHSGLFEGDIMLYRSYVRNGLLNKKAIWSDAIVPFYIDKNDFNETQIRTILNAIQEYHEQTCIRFRPYEKGDENWIIFKGNYSGCWSSVGRRHGGQVLNLNTPKCVSHGIVIHELLHALGFYHQQSASKRDEYVKIIWDNIIPGQTHNFNKYAPTHISDYGVQYDYQSIMHYSSKAFTRNGKNTIEPLDPYAALGQRQGLSKTDIKKLNTMYEEECDEDFTLFDFNGFGTYFDNIINSFQNSLYSFFSIT